MNNYPSSNETQLSRGANLDHQHKGLKTSYLLIAAAMLAIGFLGGVYRQQVIAAILPIFNIPASAESINTDQLQQTYRELKANFDGELDDQKLIEGANRGLVEAAGDKHTVFLNAKEASEYDKSLTGSIGGGIGAQIGENDGAAVAVKILPDTPAQKAGMQAGDKIIKVNDQSTSGLSSEQVVQAIRGEIGTTVRLSLLRADQSLEVDITRREITAPSVEARLQDNVGIITVSRFASDSGNLVRSEAKKLLETGAKSLILDLRGNGGGYLTAARDTASVWLNDKIVVSERAGGKEVEALKTKNNAILNNTPTVILVDENSASASEIVVGALKDHQAATIIGNTTYGKGTVQRMVQLADGAMLKVTVARWYTPNGLNLSKQGIAPDIKVALSEDDLRTGKDRQLQTALDWLNK